MNFVGIFGSQISSQEGRPSRSLLVGRLCQWLPRKRLVTSRQRLPMLLLLPLTAV